MLDDLTIERELELRRNMEHVCDDRTEDAPDTSAISKGESVNTTVHDGVFKIFMGLSRRSSRYSI